MKRKLFAICILLTAITVFMSGCSRFFVMDRDIGMLTGSKIAPTSTVDFKDEDGNILLNGKHIDRATTAYDTSIGWYITIVFTDEGAVLFEESTENNIGRAIYIYVDDVLISAPTVNAAITDGEAMITGGFTEKEANELCKSINNAIIS